jgi:hypothetical protein
MSRVLDKIKVRDPFDAAGDEALPTLALALSPSAVKSAFKRGLPRLSGEDGQTVVKSVHLIRHKPGKRAVIQYDVRVERNGVRAGKAILIGKIRARRFGNEGFRLQELFWNAGFQRESADGISVPEPIGVLPEFRMWLQRKVRGTVASEAFRSGAGPELAKRIAGAIHKLHRANVPAERSHTMADELRILHECFSKVLKVHPEWKARIGRIRAACDRLGACVPEPRPCGIHRDFYPAQVIVDGEHLYLIDFDLYCLGDPALDVGNFIGHMMEESLRIHGKATVLREAKQSLEDSFVGLTGEFVRPAVHAYTTLTLARHIYLSTQFPERAPFTESIIRLCEERLGLSR